MKILIAYYSRTGHTEKLAKAVEEELKSRGHLVDVERIQSQKEHGFLTWWNIRTFKGECKIFSPKIQDVSRYDAICIGSPNWTRLSLPMTRYFKEIKGLENKKIGLFSTTALWPEIEWYVLSAYLLDLTFSKIINEKRGRIIDSLLLSSAFKRWNFTSEYGRVKIKNFCASVESPIVSFKDYNLKQKEIENNRLFIVILSLLLISSLALEALLTVFNIKVIAWRQYLYIVTPFLISITLLIALQERRVRVYLGKYIGSFSMILLWTFILTFTGLPLGRVVILGYVLIFVLLGFFHDRKTIIFSGFLSILSYSFLFYIYSSKGILNPVMDFLLIGISNWVVVSITGNLQKYYYSLLESQDEVEIAKTGLEIKVEERTKELETLTQSLEEKVGDRTRELQEKVAELARFNRLSIGRELMMIELKKEIKKLKK